MPTLSKNEVEVLVSSTADTSGVDQMQKAVGVFSSGASKLQEAFDGATRGSRTLLAGLVAAEGSLFALGKYGVDSARQIQTAQQSMAVLAGSTTDAKNVIGELYKYVLGKPLTFPDAAMAAKTLMGYGVSAKQTIADMKTLGNISIVTGGNLDQIALAFGQVQARGRLMGQEVLQLVDQGVPVVKILADHFHKSLTDMANDMQGGTVTADQFREALAAYSSKLDISKFGNTLDNRLISLKGSLRSLAFAMLGIKIDPVQGFIVQTGGLFDRLSSSVDYAAKNLKRIPQILQEMQPYFPMITGAIAFGLIPAIGSLIAWLGLLNPWFYAFLIVGALVGLAVQGLSDHFGGFGNMLNVTWQAMSTMANFVTTMLKPSLDALWQTITTQLGPSFMQLWTTISPVLLPALKYLAIAIGIGLVAALWSAINVINVILQVQTILFRYFNQMAQTAIAAGNAVVGAVRNILAWFNALPGGASAAFGSVSRSILSILGSINPVIGAINALVGAISRAGSSMTALKNAGHSLHIPGFATGGYTGRGGADEVAGVVHKGEYVVPKSQVDQSTGLPKAGVGGSTSIQIGAVYLQDQSAVDRFFDKLQRNQELAQMGLATN